MKCKYDIFDIWQLGTYDIHSEQKEMVEVLLTNCAHNINTEFSDEEILTIISLNPSGARCYLDTRTSEYREQIYKAYFGEETKYYKHHWTSIVGKDKWTIHTTAPKGSYFGGYVISDADLNFSYQMYGRHDVYELVNVLLVIGAVIAAEVITDILIGAAVGAVVNSISRLARLCRTRGIKYIQTIAKYSDEAADSKGVMGWIQRTADDVVESGSKTKPTQPTLPKGSVPKGQHAPENNAGLIGQNNAADRLADAGYDVEMLEEVNGGNGYGIKETANPDFSIDGSVFDCYTPEASTAPKKICNKIREKTIEQSDRIILNLENVSESNINSIKEYLLERTGDTRDLKRLNELIVLLPDGNIETWFLR